MITHPRFAVLYFTDQQRALDFFTGPLGFELRTDAPYGEGRRWVEVARPDAQTYLVLAAADPQLRAIVRERAGSMSPVWFDCDDLDATHRDLVAAGVEFPVEPQAAPWDANTRWAQFADPEGNLYGLSEQRG